MTIAPGEWPDHVKGIANDNVYAVVREESGRSYLEADVVLRRKTRSPAAPVVEMRVPRSRFERLFTAVEVPK